MKLIKNFYNFDNPINETFSNSDEVIEIIRSYKKENDLLESLDDINDMKNAFISDHVYIANLNNNNLLKTELEEDGIYGLVYKVIIHYEINQKNEFKVFNDKLSDINLIMLSIEEMIDRNSNLEVKENNITTTEDGEHMIFRISLTKNINDEIRKAYNEWRNPLSNRYIEFLNKLKEIYREVYDINLDKYIDTLDDTPNSKKDGIIHAGVFVNDDVEPIGYFNKKDEKYYIDYEAISLSGEEIKKAT